MNENIIAITEPSGALIDYALQNAQDPDLFQSMPPLARMAQLGPGDEVKIGLEPRSADAHVEHFWVEIREKRGVTGFIGKVVNDLQPALRVRFGDHLIFCAQHIREIKEA